MLSELVEPLEEREKNQKKVEELKHLYRFDDQRFEIRESILAGAVVKMDVLRIIILPGRDINLSFENNKEITS